MRKCDYCKHNGACTFADISECAIRDYIRFERYDADDCSERHKLIGLLRGHNLDTMDDIERMADFLLRNGVTIRGY